MFITYEEARKIRLSKNFTLDEFIYSSTALRKGIDNSLPTELLPKLQYLVDTILQPLRDKFGPLKINSGYRSVELCITIGSNEHSNHAYGLAVDVEAYSHKVSNIMLLDYIANNMEYKELIAEYFNKEVATSGWVHVAAEEGNNKGGLKLKDKEHNYSNVELAYLQELYPTEA